MQPQIDARRGKTFNFNAKGEQHAIANRCQTRRNIQSMVLSFKKLRVIWISWTHCATKRVLLHGAYHTKFRCSTVKLNRRWESHNLKLHLGLKPKLAWFHYRIVEKDSVCSEWLQLFQNVFELMTEFNKS